MSTHFLPTLFPSKENKSLIYSISDHGIQSLLKIQRPVNSQGLPLPKATQTVFSLKVLQLAEKTLIFHGI
jgi:hypothetical protein